MSVKHWTLNFSGFFSITSLLKQTTIDQQRVISIKLIFKSKLPEGLAWWPNRLIIHASASIPYKYSFVSQLAAPLPIHPPACDLGKQ